MRVFFVTVGIFLLLLGVILLNTFFVSATAAGLEERLLALPAFETAEMALDGLEDYWQAHRNRLGLSLSSDTVLLLDERLAELRAAALTSDVPGFERARAMLLAALRDLRETQRLTLDNLL